MPWFQLGQKELLIDMQGNWGNTYTGDSAAAPRYIEARLSKFALDVVFNPKTTNWLASYDGRNKEPETLPVKFPLLLNQGAEGIAVGLSCKILPHNFNELIDGCIALLRKRSRRSCQTSPPVASQTLRSITTGSVEVASKSALESKREKICWRSQSSHLGKPPLL